MSTYVNKLPNMVDIEPLEQIGYDYRTGLPKKMSGGEEGSWLKSQIKQEIRKNDKQIALTRYKWSGLPDGLTSEIIETVLYERGQGMLFFNENDKKFYFLPFVLQAPTNSTGLDCYGRLLGVSPIPLVGGVVSTEGKPQPWIPGYVKTPIYEPWFEEITPESQIDHCVLLYDYSHSVNQPYITPMVNLQEGIIDVMAECIPFSETALISSCGTMGMRVNAQDEVDNVAVANNQIKNASLQGRPFIPIKSTAGLDFQALAEGQVAKTEEFLLAMQSYDNFRLGQYGIGEGAVFTKKAHMLESEQSMNQGTTGLVYNDGLLLRQEFCLMAFSLWGVMMWCEADEMIVGLDKNLDGEVSEEADGQESIDNPMNGGGEDTNE